MLEDMYYGEKWKEMVRSDEDGWEWRFEGRRNEV